MPNNQSPRPEDYSSIDEFLENAPPFVRKGYVEKLTPATYRLFLGRDQLSQFPGLEAHLREPISIALKSVTDEDRKRFTRLTREQQFNYISHEVRLPVQLDELLEKLAHRVGLEKNFVLTTAIEEYLFPERNSYCLSYIDCLIIRASVRGFGKIEEPTRLCVVEWERTSYRKLCVEADKSNVALDELVSGLVVLAVRDKQYSFADKLTKAQRRYLRSWTGKVPTSLFPNSVDVQDS